MVKYRYRKKGYFNKGVKLFLLLLIIPVIIFVAPEAFIPVDWIPNFWSNKSLFMVVLENQFGFFLIFVLVLIIMVMKIVYDMVSISW